MAVWSEVKFSDINRFTRIDGDFYKPEYLKTQEILKDSLPLSHYITEIIHPSEFKRIYTDDGYYVLRAQNVRPLKIDIGSNPVFIPKPIAENLPNNNLRFGDVLMTRTGANFGQTALYTEEVDDAVATSHTFIIRTNDKIESSYLALFFNTNYGRKLIDQGMYGSSQPEIAPKFLKMIPIPRFDIEIEKKLSTDVLEAYKLRKQSQDLYQQATELLDKELGLDTIVFEKPRSYTATFSEVISNNRADSEYYQVHFRQIEEHLKSLNTLFLGTICNFIKGYEVGSSLYTENGPTFIRVSNFTKHGFSFGDSDKHISNGTYNLFKGYKPNIGDILLTKDGTVGMCYVVDEEIEGIVSSGIVNLTLLDETIPKEYLALVINSKICQMQANRDCSGALISHWKPQDIRKMKIPLLNADTMKKLNDLVIKSKSALRESKQLLEQAKQRVEELIENAAGVQND